VLLVVAVGLYLVAPSDVFGRSVTVVPAPKVYPSLSSDFTVPGSPVALPWPSAGEGAVVIQGLGVVASSPDQTPSPIASVTKMMTALLVLRSHPLSGDEGGPNFTMTAGDAATYQAEAAEGDSTLDVIAGESIDERQLLEALLIPSADNIARFLAIWDAGSMSAFVAKMNAEAATLGMTETHYADASGLDPATVSTATDQAILASVAMKNPVFASIVDMASVVLPVAGLVTNYNPVVGDDGIVGVKTGFTPQAGSCLVAAAYRSVAGHRVLVITAALGQPNGLSQAAGADINLLNTVTAELRAVAVPAVGSQVGEVGVSWSDRRTPIVVAPGAVGAVGWPGLTLSARLVPGKVLSSRAGATVGAIEVRSSLGPVGSEPAVLGADLPPLPPGDVLAKHTTSKRPGTN
jgi:D-alanyl-D-alanine carboxypeptidase (penicillin-binding protein 5/6)